jgi:hypothetical protein
MTVSATTGVNEKQVLSNQFESEEVHSSYCYPEDYVVKPITEQADILAKIFSVSPDESIEFMERVLPSRTLPDGAEGWFAIPRFEKLGNYNIAVEKVLAAIAAKHIFYNYREGKLGSEQLRLHPRTAFALQMIGQEQKGDILVIPSQFGLRHRGRSVRRACQIMPHAEFGHGSVAVGAMLLTHPERIVRWKQLHVTCGGDEYAEHDSECHRIPYFNFSDGHVGFGTVGSGHVDERYGTASGFFAQ